MLKTLLSIHELNLEEAIAMIKKLKREGKEIAITTYSMEEFISKLSLVEKIQWKHFCGKGQK